VRVAVISTEYGGVTEHSGGFGQRLAVFLPALASSGVDVDVYLFPVFALRPRFGAARRTVLAPRLAVHVEHGARHDGALGPLRLAAAVRSTMRSVRQPYDAVIAPEWLGAAALLPRRFRRRLVTNLVTSLALIRDVEGRATNRAPRNLLRERLQVWLERRQVQRSALCVACSSAIASWAADRWAVRRLEVLPNCIDVDAVRAAAASHPRPEWAAGSATIVYAGRLERRKGVFELVRAFGRVASEMPSATLVLVGRDTDDGAGEPVSRVLRRELRPEVAERVRFLGDQPHERVVAAMAAATITVFPSTWEAFGNVALEAKAVGAPVIVTGGSGFDSFCTDRADSLVVPPGQAEPLADAIRLLLSDAGLRTAITETAGAEIGRYDARVVASGWRTVLETVG
jgi:glycosyltransferase involved in cell wall biosynthesis